MATALSNYTGVLSVRAGKVVPAAIGAAAGVLCVCVRFLSESLTLRFL